MDKVLRSSEFWVGLIALLGQAGATIGWWAQADFDQVLMPALVYVAGRLISKAAKSVPTKEG